MVIYAKGANPDALERSGQLLLGYSRDCDSARGEASKAIRALESQWGGGDFQALKSRWPAADAHLAQLGSQLGLLSQRLLANAQQQRGASSSTSSGAPAQGHVTPKPKRHWWDSVTDTAGDVGAWTYNHTVVPTVNELANIGQAMIEHPEDTLAMALGAGAIVLGSGGEAGGLLLDATGVGAVVGVPVNVASAGLIAVGATTLALGAGDLVSNASQNDNHVLNEAKGPSESRPQPGDPLPQGQRPSTAGESWEGRVSDTGKGEVWQNPENVNPAPGTPKDANSVRIMEPTSEHPGGYVRFYNEHGQPVDLNGKPGPNDATHIDIRPDGSYDIPTGWNP